MLRIVLLLLFISSPALAGNILASTAAGGGGGGTAPQLEGTPVAAGFQASATGTCPAMTVAVANETIFIASNIGVTGSGLAPTVSSVSSAGPAPTTWGVLSGGHNATIFDNTAALSSTVQSAVIYWARVTSAGTYTPSITWSAAADAGSVICWAVSGVADLTNPQDGNASLAVTAGGHPAPPSINGLSTATDNTMMLYFRTAYQNATCNGTAGPPVGWATLKYNYNGAGATNYACGEVDYKIVSTPQTSLTITGTNTGVGGTGVFTNWVAIGTALTAAPPSEEFVGPLSGWKNVKADYGALGNSSAACGGADDSAAIQSGLNGLSPTNPVLYFPAGTYKITRALYLRIAQYYSVIGEDPATTTIMWCGATAATTFSGTITNDGTVNTMHAGPVTGVISIGQAVTPNGTDIPSGLFVYSQASGTTGAAGDYVVRDTVQSLVTSASQTISTNNDKMLWLDGVALSNFRRLTFDGQSHINIGIDQSKSLVYSENYFDTTNEFSDLVLKNFTVYGYVCGRFGGGCAESTHLRNKFINIGYIALQTINDNALDLWIWDSLFDGNNMGVANQAGDFKVYSSVFRNSAVSDVWYTNTGVIGLRNNYSRGSKKFIGGPADNGYSGGTGAFDGTQIVGNTIIDTTDALSINSRTAGPIFFANNTMRTSPTAATVLLFGGPDSTATAGPRIMMGNTTGAQATNIFSIGNKFTVGSGSCNNTTSPVFGGTAMPCYEINDQVVSTGSIDATEPILPPPPLNYSRSITDVTPTGVAATDTANITNAISGCVSIRCVVHLKAGTFNINATLGVPANSTMQIIGDGFYTELAWVGAGTGPVLQVNGPSKIVLRDFQVNGTSNAGNGINITNSDQSGAQIHIENSIGFWSYKNAFIDSLDRARVEVHSYVHSYSDPSRTDTSFQVVGGLSAAAGTWLGGITQAYALESAGYHYGYRGMGGAHAAFRDVFHDGGNDTLGTNQNIDLTGPAGSFSVSGAYWGLTNPTQTAINVHDYQGNSALIAQKSSGLVTLSGTATGGVASNIGIGGVVYSDGSFYTNTSTGGTVALRNASYSSDPFGGLIAASGTCDPTCFTNSLADIMAPPIRPSNTASGVTDVRLRRVFVEYAQNGIHIMGPPQIASVSSSGNSFLPGSASGTLVGTLTATMNYGSAFSGTWSLSTSADICNGTTGAGNSSFSIASGNQLVLNGTGVGGTYAVCVLATQAGIINSPKGLALTITGGIVFVNSADLGDNGGAGTSYTASYTSGSGARRLLVLLIDGDSNPGGNDDITGVTYGGAAMTLAAKNTTGGSSVRYNYIYYLLGGPTGVNNFVVNSTSAHYIIMVAGEYNGVNPVGQLDSTATSGTSSTTSITTSDTITTAGSWAVLLECHAGFIVPTAVSGVVLRRCGGAFTQPCLFDSNGGLSAGSHSFTTSISGGSATDLRHVVAAFKR